jgi:hypothetical protein
VFKKIVLPILFVFAIIVSQLTISTRVHATSVTNLALNQSMTGYPLATAPYSYGNLLSVLDGNFNYVGSNTTRWTSWNSGQATDYLIIDFGSATLFNQVKLYIFNDGGGVQAPADYSIQYWDGSTWINTINPIKSPTTPQAALNNAATPENTLNSVVFNSVTSQKLRVVFTNKGTNIYSGVVELEVYLDTTTDDFVASTVVTQIGILPLQASVQLSNKTAIEAARAAYDALTSGQKILVNNLTTLTDAESALATLEAAQAADESAASTVETQIGLLPLQANVVLSDKTAIEEARAAYDALTADQKSSVDNLDTLTHAEAALSALEASLTEINILTAFSNAEGNRITLKVPSALDLTYIMQTENYRIVANGVQANVLDAHYELTDPSGQTIILTLSSPVLLNETLVTISLLDGAFKTIINELNIEIDSRPVTTFSNLDLSLDQLIGVDDVVQMIGNPVSQIDVNQDGFFNRVDIHTILGQISKYKN